LKSGPNLSVTFSPDWTLHTENLAIMDDLALLKDYAESGSEDAFRELVSRHVATVYSAARRQAGDSLAADVTQAVFVLLARKAGRLGPKTVLVAWLLTTTRLVSRATMRSEIRRQRWEKEAATMPSNYQEIEVQSAWEKVQPMLDDALARLPEKDRGLIALRFFQNKSHAEIAAALGLNEEASKKRLSRAIEKLRGFFSKRGVILGTAILLSALSQNAVQAAPRELVSHITAAATGGAASPSVVALVKATLKLMTWIKIKIIGLSAAAVLVAASVPIAAELSRSDSDAIKTDGREAKIERYEFTSDAVRYSYPANTYPLNPKAGEGISRPEFPGEPLLSAEFSWEISAKHPAPEGLHVVAADELGNEFDPVVQAALGSVGENREYWIDDIPIFPRRGKEVHLRVMDGRKLLAEFKIPNPAPDPHPIWTPQPLPVLATNGDLEVSLTEFRAIRPTSEAALKEPRFARTECTFGFREHGRDTTSWTPVLLEVADATGNHWMPSRSSGGNPYRSKTENGVIQSKFSGALWPGESAWKIRGDFLRTADFPENELLHLPKVVIPDATEVSEPLKKFDWNGATVELSAVMGTNSRASITRPPNGAPLEQRMHWSALMNSEFRSGCVTVVLAGEILSRNRQLAFVKATDEQGREFEKMESGSPVSVEQTRWPMPYSFALRPPEGAHEINLVVAITEPRKVEFLAKPEQVEE
jgi:RNA polymerase sigma factor (sigma-70 family)